MKDFLRHSGRAAACIALLLWIAPNGWADETAAPRHGGEIPALDTIPVEVDLVALPPSERAALVKIVEASRVMDALYMHQVWPGTAALVAQLSAEQTADAQAQLKALLFYKGPWLPNGQAFVAGVSQSRPLGDFYPPTATKDSLEAWLKSLPKAEAEQAMSPWSAIRMNADGRLAIVPYSQCYAGELGVAAELLTEAADLTHEPSLAKFLRERAHALLTDDYYESDLAFVDLVGPVDIVFGPYEPDDDTWFNTKTAFEASIGVVNTAATRRVESLASHLQELENNLPLPAALRGRKLGGVARVVVVDAVYQGGMSAAGSVQAGYGLPNDVRVLQGKGARTGTYRNILAIRYEKVFKPIAAAILSPADQAQLHFDNVLDEILMVRIFDSLGPQRVTGTDRPIAEALQDTSVAAGQIRSMLLSLWAHQYLIDHGYLDRSEEQSLFQAFLVPALARLRQGLGSGASQGSTYILNRLLEAGAIRVDTSHHVVIDPNRARETIESAAREFVPLMAAGDKAAIKAQLAKYVVIRPEAKGMLDQLGPAPSAFVPVFRTADLLQAE